MVKSETNKCELSLKICLVLSGVSQGTVLGPVLFSLYINDITTDIDSEIRLFADDCVIVKSKVQRTL